MILLADGVLQPPSPGARISARGLRVLLFAGARTARATGLAEGLDRVTLELRARGADVRRVTGADLGLVRASRRARDLVRAEAPTIVHVATPDAVGRAGRQAACALGVPLVTSVLPAGLAVAPGGACNLPARLRTRGAWAYRRWFHGAARVTLCPTRGVAAELARRGVGGARPWGPGVDARCFHPEARSATLRARLGARPDDVVVAHVAPRGACRRDLELALDAFALARAAVGRSLRLATATHDVAPTTPRGRTPPGAVHLGPLDRDGRAALRASAELSLHVAARPGLGGALLEAMAAGVAIVAVDADASRALLECPASGPPRGAVVRAADAAIASRLAALADDREARDMFVRRGLAYAARLGWDDVVDCLLESYAAAARAP